MTAICVYCASSHGARPAYAEAARSLGREIGARGFDLVYGGGHVGLMGEVADEVLAAGRNVTGVITSHLYALEVGHTALTELVVVDDMSTRKRAMFERADAFAILPGGLGTMEELFEVWCWAALGLHPKSLGVLDVDGYFEDLLRFMRRAVDDGLLGAEHFALLRVAQSAADLLDLLVLN
jgi:uncharacterized protein (TIGR00730 family)